MFLIALERSVWASKPTINWYRHEFEIGRNFTSGGSWRRQSSGKYSGATGYSDEAIHRKNTAYKNTKRYFSSGDITSLG